MTVLVTCNTKAYAEVVALLEDAWLVFWGRGIFKNKFYILVQRIVRLEVRLKSILLGLRRPIKKLLSRLAIHSGWRYREDFFILARKIGQ